MLQHPLYSQTTIMAMEVIKHRDLDVWVNFHVIEDGKNETQLATIFPRLLNL